MLVAKIFLSLEGLIVAGIACATAFSAGLLAALDFAINKKTLEKA